MSAFPTTRKLISAPPFSHAWALRNYLWATIGPKFAADTEEFAADTEENVSIPELRYAIIDNFLALSRLNLVDLVRSDHTIATDQIIRYPPVSDDSRYTFSL